jgi:RimJ/RimL family protein N-acetyltransferase
MHRLKNIELRPVEESDAAFILESRSDPSRAKFLRPVSSLAAQQQWIREYKTREAVGEEYYFIAQHRSTGEPLGAVRMHDITGGSFTWGSWFTRPGAPHWAGLETVLALYEFGFARLGLQHAVWEVMEDNPSAAWHDTYARRTGVRPGFIDFAMTAEEHAALKKRYRGRFVRDDSSSAV